MCVSIKGILSCVCAHARTCENNITELFSDFGTQKFVIHQLSSVSCLKICKLLILCFDAVTSFIRSHTYSIFIINHTCVSRNSELYNRNVQSCNSKLDHFIHSRQHLYLKMNKMNHSKAFFIIISLHVNQVLINYVQHVFLFLTESVLFFDLCITYSVLDAHMHHRIISS